VEELDKAEKISRKL